MDEWDSGIPSALPSSIPSTTPGLSRAGSNKSSWNPFKAPRQSGATSTFGRAGDNSWAARQKIRQSGRSSTQSTQSIVVFAEAKDVSRFSESQATDWDASEKADHEEFTIPPVPSLPYPLPPEATARIDSSYSVMDDGETRIDRDSIRTKDMFESFPAPPLPVANTSKTRAVQPPPLTLMATMTTQSSIKSSHSRNASLDKNLPEPPYHIFSLTKKRQMVWLVAFLSFLSTITSTIYFPVLNAFSTRFRTNAATALASITIYMIPQALVPFFSIPTCQYFGRRATTISLLIIYFFANLGLALVDNVAGFMVLRVMQALGIGAVPALAVIVIEDISVSQERSELIAELNKILIATQFLGPILGGAFSQGFGFQSIFVFLIILSVIAITLVLVILPETLRGIAGNGTVQLPKWQLPLKDLRKPASPPRLTRIITPLSKPYPKAIFSPFEGVFRLDIITTVLFGSCIYAVLLSVIVTIPTLLQTNFRLTAAETGAAFLPGAIGVVTAWVLTNYLIPRDYEIISRQYRIENYILDFKPIDAKKHLNFPIEQARLRNIRPFILTFIGVVGGYGFSTRRFLAISLLLQFFIAGSATGILRLNALLAEDLYHGEASSINMVINSFRLLFAALWVGIIQFIILGIQAKFAFLLLSMLVLLFSPLLFIQFRYGMKWRLDREARTRDTESLRTEKGTNTSAGQDQNQSQGFLVGGISKMEEGMWNLKNRLRYMWERIVQEALEGQGRVKRWTRMN